MMSVHGYDIEEQLIFICLI